MRIMIVGNCGSGKSTLAKQLVEKTHYPLMQLDHLWHQTDYSDSAKQWFIAQQQAFVQQKDWLIEGNYGGTMPIRLAKADLILYLKINPVTAVYRVLKRSWHFRLDHNSRPEMPKQFSEHFDHDYWDFLKFVYHYDEAQTRQRIQRYQRPQSKLIILQNQADKQRFLANWQHLK